MGVVQGTNPLSYVGVAAPNPANVIPAQRAPLTTDINYEIGTLWVDVPNDDSYQLTSVVANVANWTFLGSAATPVNDVPHGGTGVATILNHGIMIGQGVAPIATVAVGATGTVLAGSTGADPAFTATPSVTSITATTVSGTTINTNVAAAELSLTGTTVGVDGTDANIDLNLASKGTGALLYTRSLAANDLNMQITNSDNTDPASMADIQIATGGSSSGDPYVRFEISGVGASTISMGIDNSDSDFFKISQNNTVGTNDILKIDPVGKSVAVVNDFYVNAGTLNVLANDSFFSGLVEFAADGKTISSEFIATTTAAGDSAFGQVTLVGGTATIATTAIGTADKVILTRMSPGATGAAALGLLSVGTIVDGTSFVINALNPADSTALIATDVSEVFWMIIKNAT